MEVLFEKVDSNLNISIGNTKFFINLNDVKINNDELTEFLTDLAAYFIDEEYVYKLEPAEALEDQRVKLLVELVERFVVTFQEEFKKSSLEYEKQIKNIKTKINS